MTTSCSIEMFIKLFLISWICFSLFVRESVPLIIAKSHITVCENTDKDPINVVYNKRCEKKLVVIARVNSGQGETEKLYVTVNKAYDELEKEKARLYNPFIVTLSMSPMFLVYPIYYRATVNNKPREQVKLRRKHHCKGGAGCRRHVDSEGKVIFKSEGFCCTCLKKGIYGSARFKSFSSAEHKLNYKRGDMDCDRYKSSLHCMYFDRLWYDLHDIGRYTFDFTIWVKAYDQVTKVKGNRTVIEWVDGGQLELSPTKSGGVGKHGRLIAKYIGQFSAGTELPDLGDHFLMVPNAAKLKYDVRTHPQLKNGYKDYLIITKEYVTWNNSAQCDVIGVTLQAFTQQSTIASQTGFGCYQKKGTCLRNQIQDFFEEDQLRRDRGEKTEFFPETYGKITGLKERPGSTDRVVEFESDLTHSVLVYLEISADDLILVYNRASGLIVKAFAKEFEAQSRNGKATVIVQNTGFVTADFYVSLEACSSSVKAGEEQTASINPQNNYEFEFKLEVYDETGGSFSCNVILYDARRTLVDTSVLSVNTTGTCICILGCGCSCTDQDFVCVNESDVIFDDEKLGTYSDFGDYLADKLGVVFETIGDVFGAIKSILSSIWSLVPLLGYLPVILIIVAFIILLCVARMICQLTPTGLVTTVLKRAVKAAKPENKSQPPPRPTVVVIREESESETEESDEEMDVTGQDENRRSMKTTEFLFEFFFFFILPFLMVYEVAKLVWRLSLGRIYPWIKERFGLCEDNEDSSEDEHSNSDKESDSEDSNSQ